MNCTIQGCPGYYEHRPIVHTLNVDGQVTVFEGVPAEVCVVCSDVLLAPSTIRRLELLEQDHPTPQKHAPIYAYT